MGTALAHSDEGHNMLVKLATKIINDTKLYTENMRNSIITHICLGLSKDSEAFELLVNYYAKHINDNIDNLLCLSYIYNSSEEDDCKKYISSCDKDKKNINIFEISRYLPYTEVEDYLINLLDDQKVKEDIKEEIMYILLLNFNTQIIDKAEVYREKNPVYFDMHIVPVLAPAILLYDFKTKKYKEYVKKAKKLEEANKGLKKLKDELLGDFEINEESTKEDMLQNIYNNLMAFKEKTQKKDKNIVKYREIRKKYSDLVGDMFDDFCEGKFNMSIDQLKNEITTNKEVRDFNFSFNLKDQFDIGAALNVVLYKNADNVRCMTEEYLSKNIYEDRKDMLKAMFDSKVGLFEVVDTEPLGAKVNLKNVFTKEEYVVYDINLSANRKVNEDYIYTRIISFDEINFLSGFMMVFDKGEIFIRKFISNHFSCYNKETELNRFLELYERYVKTGGKYNMVLKEI
ncbi:MAG: hypothetical protein IJ809_06880 [Clostridia bacterium]|nr:hypothetical protein [Clostridia bacterium]